MQVRQFYELINELNLNKEQLKIMKKIINAASKNYVRVRNSGNLFETNQLDFIINGYFIEQTELLDILGIKVEPKRVEKYHTSYDHNKYTSKECKTNISFPTRLLKSDKKDKVLEKIRQKNLYSQKLSNL